MTRTGRIGERRVVYRHPWGFAFWVVMSLVNAGFYWSSISDDPGRYFNWWILALALLITVAGWRLLVSNSVVADGQGLILRHSFRVPTRIRWDQVAGFETRVTGIASNKLDASVLTVSGGIERLPGISGGTSGERRHINRVIAELTQRWGSVTDA